jgi:tetratricopeptide (TPR) repeat protein
MRRERRQERQGISRRAFLARMGATPMLLTRGSWYRGMPEFWDSKVLSQELASVVFSEKRFVPHYPQKSPLDDVIRLVAPGSDEYVTEKYAAEIAETLREWTKALRNNPPALDILGRLLTPSLQATPLTRMDQKTVRAAYGIEVFRKTFGADTVMDRGGFLEEIRAYLAPWSRIQTAAFEITKIEQTKSAPLSVSAEVRYEFVGLIGEEKREERIGYWDMEWSRTDSGRWQASSWRVKEEKVSRARLPTFLDVTAASLGHIPSYSAQLLHGTDYWRTVMDGASGIDVYGNTGIAAGDYDGDGFDDLYICQPPGLPNRLYRNRGDGTFEDKTEASGLGLLDGTACALFADFENKGLQDLLVVCATGPLLFVNEGNGKFTLRRDAFRFENAPEGTFTHAAVADYDRDGRLDVYFCLYNYYSGLEQYHYPVPYFDARNGPPNFLLHNEGDGKFVDHTRAAGLNVENDRYSFSCIWGDYDGDGWPDLYVVNDFGRNNLYRNKCDGTFAAVSDEAKANEPGAGMSACWVDFDNDGRLDIYAAGMWVPSGMRIFDNANFHGNAPQSVRVLYQRHMLGNSLYRNQGNGRFENVASQAGAEIGRWAWSTGAWDLDHDGYEDLYVANGYISGCGDRDASSFFWRQVVAKSPDSNTPSESYERAWNAINELIRSDATWNGRERNVCYVNNQDGTFSDVSGSVGLDFLDDSRSFVFADLDHDGRLEIVLKNRTAPQVRVLRNAMKELGKSIAFRLQGKKSNRDAIGAAVTVEAHGRKQTKLLQAGTGFLSQHSKELFFGVGAEENVRASIRWPSGVTQTFENLPVNHRIEIREEDPAYQKKPFGNSPVAFATAAAVAPEERLPASFQTWLVQPMPAPDFSLPDMEGKNRQLSEFRGQPVLLQLWSAEASSCLEQLRLLEQKQKQFDSQQLVVLGINVDGAEKSEAIRSLVAREKLSLPIVLATDEVAGIYNITYRYMFDRRRDLELPTSFLLNRAGFIVKVYQGPFEIMGLLNDLRAIPQSSAELQAMALPMKGISYLGEFQRNDFTYAVALFQRGYLQAAANAFKAVIANHPDNPEAYYNLGTLYVIQKALPEARGYIEKALQLRPEYAEAWNNLAMISAQQGDTAAAIDEFQKAIQLRPTYVTALVNCGNLLRRKGDFAQAQQLLARALEASPESGDANYSMGMLYAQQSELQKASEFLEKAVALKPEDTEALNNLGVLRVRQGQYAEAETTFERCIAADPKFDQAYLNLARLYVLLNNKEKARAVLQALLREQPQHKMAQQALETLN